MGSIRSFVAIELPETTRQWLAKAQADLMVQGFAAKWVHHDSIHLTLKFLGDIRLEQLGPIKEVLAAAASSASSFSLRLTRPGVFPSLSRPRVLWVGVEDDSGVLMDLQGKIEEGLKGLGFEPEEREYSPHLTLARIKEVRRKGELQRAMDSITLVGVEPVSVDHFNLMRSELKSTGAVYTVLESFNFRC